MFSAIGHIINSVVRFYIMVGLSMGLGYLVLYVLGIRYPGLNANIALSLALIAAFLMFGLSWARILYTNQLYSPNGFFYKYILMYIFINPIWYAFLNHVLHIESKELKQSWKIAVFAAEVYMIMYLVALSGLLKLLYSI